MKRKAKLKYVGTAQHPGQESTTLTWATIARQEPALGRLLGTVAQADAAGGASRSFCGVDFWYSEVKPQLVQLVGYDLPGGHGILGTAIAYDVALGHLWKALPPCRNCTCGG